MPIVRAACMHDHCQFMYICKLTNTSFNTCAASLCVFCNNRTDLPVFMCIYFYSARRNGRFLLNVIGEVNLTLYMEENFDRGTHNN